MNNIKTSVEITIKVISIGDYNKVATAEESIIILDEKDICTKCIIQDLIERTQKEIERQR